YDLHPGQLKETLVLRSAMSPSLYQFFLRAPEEAQMKARQQADGSWAFTSGPSPDPVFVLDAPVVAESQPLSPACTPGQATTVSTSTAPTATSVASATTGSGSTAAPAVSSGIATTASTATAPTSTDRRDRTTGGDTGSRREVQ